MRAAIKTLFGPDPTMTTLNTLTARQIASLRSEAASHGDLKMVKVCDRAAAGSAAARKLVVDAIQTAEAMAD